MGVHVTLTGVRGAFAPFLGMRARRVVHAEDACSGHFSRRGVIPHGGPARPRVLAPGPWTENLSERPDDL